MRILFSGRIHTKKTHSILKIKRMIAGILMSLLVACLLVIQATPAVHAVSTETFEPLHDEFEFYPVLYNNTNGLPTAEANDIVQTSDGFIWIACYAGLIRYDGTNFVRLDSTEGINSISCLIVDRQDRLWIGTNENGVAVMEDGKFTFWDEKDGLGSPKVRELAEDDQGNIYAGTASGVAMITPDFEIKPLTDSRIANAYVDSMVPGTDSLIYCTTNDDELFILRDGNLVNFYENDGSEIENITAIYPDPKVAGKMYYGTEKSGIYHFDIKGGLESAEHIDIEPLHSVNWMEVVDDRLWVCTRGGIGMVDENGFHDLTYLPLNNSIDSMMEDYEGNLWFTSSRLGVMKLVTNRFENIFADYGIPETVVNSTCLLDGNMYIGTDTGLVVIDKNGIVDSVPVTSAKTASGEPFDASNLVSLLSDSRVRSVIRDSKNRLWITSWQNLGLLCYDHGDLTIYSKDTGLLSDRIRSVYERKDGSMLVALTGGLNIIKDGQVIGTYDKNYGIENDETLITCEAPNGDILLGSNGDGMYIINSSGIRNIDRDDGLTSGVIMRIKYDEENKVFWLVTGNSIAYMTEDYKVTTVHNFPYPDNLDIIKNSKGDMWILSSDGIYVVPAEQLLANEEIEPVHYGIVNGLPCIATSNAYNEITADGDLYLSGRSGVAKINIEAPLEEVQDIKMAVPWVELDDVVTYPNKNGVFTIPAGTKKLAVYGYVFDYSLTDPTIEIKLDGFDREMITFKRSELKPIYYTNLKSGKYTFVMELKDAMGRESKTLKTTIIKEKAFYEQTAFAIGVAIAAIILFMLLLQKLVGRRLRIIEEKNREERQRELAANEMHMANQIQTAVLPHVFPPFPNRKEFDLYASMDPAREVGGDFYDFFLIDDDHLGLVIADVSGKGIPAALFMMNAKLLMKSYAQNGITPSEVFEKANNEICEDNQAEMFVTAWLGILEISSGKMIASNAGHEYPAIGHPDTGFELMKDKHGLVIGAMESMKYQDYEIQFAPGDKIFVYTDGVPEASNAKNELFGTDRMLDALNINKDAAPEEMLENVYKAVGEFVGDAEQFDDLTMLGFVYHGPREK